MIAINFLIVITFKNKFCHLFRSHALCILKVEKSKRKKLEDICVSERERMRHLLMLDSLEFKLGLGKTE